MIEKIKNPYIPKDFDGSLGGCGGTTCSGEVPRAWLSRYTEVEINDKQLLREDITGAYTPQGGCVHNGYIYRALVKADEEPAIIQKIDIATGDIVKAVQYVCGHANDLFVKEGYLYILHSSSTNIVYQFTLDTLEFLSVEQTGPTRWGQAYNTTDKIDVIGNVGSAYFSVYKNGVFLYRIKPDNAFSGMVRQGIFCSDNYIGVSLDNAYGAVIENNLGSRIMFYTWNGMFIKSVHVSIAEIEWSDYVDGTLYIGTYDGRDPNNVKSGKIYAIPFDLYPEQTVQTGRPTDVSGGLNNLHRLPEGTHVKLWQGTQSEGTIKLLTADTRLQLDEDGPFRYLIFEYDGANANTYIWFPKNNGVPILREFDITAAATDSNIRLRELRATFDVTKQEFTIESNLVEQLLSDVSEGTLVMTKSPEGIAGIKIRSIWGVV